MRKSVIGFLTLVLLMTTSSCNSGSKTPTAANNEPPAKKAAAPQYETGRNAFQKLMVAARGFSPDVKPYRLESEYTPDAPASEGKAGIWRAQFAAPAKHSIKAYSWSGVGDSPGVNHGTEDTYNPSNTSTQIFELAFLKIDSDKAFEVAQKHGGEKLTKKDPKQPVFYVLDFNSSKSELIWHVLYGENRNNTKLSIAVNATSGAFMHVEH